MTPLAVLVLMHGNFRATRSAFKARDVHFFSTKTKKNVILKHITKARRREEDPGPGSGSGRVFLMSGLVHNRKCWRIWIDLMLRLTLLSGWWHKYLKYPWLILSIKRFKFLFSYKKSVTEPEWTQLNLKNTMNGWMVSVWIYLTCFQTALTRFQLLTSAGWK